MQRAIRDVVYNKGVSFPIKLEVLVYKCERCGCEWERYAISKRNSHFCPLYKCQGSLLTKIIRRLKGQNPNSIGRVIRSYDIEVKYGWTFPIGHPGGSEYDFESQKSNKKRAYGRRV